MAGLPPGAGPFFPPAAVALAQLARGAAGRLQGCASPRAPGHVSGSLLRAPVELGQGTS